MTILLFIYITESDKIMTNHEETLTIIEFYSYIYVKESVIKLKKRKVDF